MHPSVPIRRLAPVLALALAACALPSAPPDDLTFTDVSLTSPLWTAGSARDSTFAASYPFRYFSGATTTQRTVIRKPEALASLWETLNRGFEPPSPPPAVDFGQEMVIFVALGGRSSGGYSVGIRHVTMLRDTLFVLVSERAPGPSCLVFAAFTQPTDARVVPRTTAPVRFRIQQEQLDCR
jgi:hypothetical protein